MNHITWRPFAGQLICYNVWVEDCADQASHMPELEDLLAFEAWWQTNTTLSKTTFTLIVIVYPHWCDRELWLSLLENLPPKKTSNPSICNARLQPDQAGTGKDLVPIRPVAMLTQGLEGKMDEMYQLFWVTKRISQCVPMQKHPCQCPKYIIPYFTAFGYTCLPQAGLVSYYVLYLLCISLGENLAFGQWLVITPTMCQWYFALQAVHLGPKQTMLGIIMAVASTWVAGRRNKKKVEA